MFTKRFSISFVICILVMALLATSCSPPKVETIVPATQAQTEVVSPVVKPTEPQPATAVPATAPPATAVPATVPPKVEGGIVTVGVTYDTPNMDHLTSGTTFAAQLLIFDTLVARAPDGTYHGLLAKSWEISADNLTWTFTLRNDVKFHDGTPFNAAAAKWFFDKARDPNGQHAFSSSYTAVKEILAPDDTTLIFKLNNPWPNILFTVSTSFAGLISPTAYEKYGKDYGTKYAVGTGPFILEEWVPQEKTAVKRNPDYKWGPDFLQNTGAPHVDEVIFKFLPEATTRVAELEIGGLDILTGVPTADLPRIKDSGKFDIKSMPAYGGALFYIDMNQTKPPLNELNVRQALNYAVDREKVASIFLGQYGQAAYGYMASHWKCGYSDPKSISYLYDPEKAKQLLAAAGWTDSNGDGVVDKGGNPFSMKMYIYNDSESQSYGEILQAELAAVGIKVDLLPLEYSSMVDYFKSNENQLSLINYGWPDSDVYNLFFASDQIPYLNSSHINDPKIDDLLKKANTAPTHDERCQFFADLEKYAIEQAVWVPVFWQTDITAVNKRIKDYLLTPYYESYNDITITAP
jgi:peptide/nickel transport system substrate-binding protein